MCFCLINFVVVVVVGLQVTPVYGMTRKDSKLMKGLTNTYLMFNDQRLDSNLDQQLLR